MKLAKGSLASGGEPCRQQFEDLLIGAEEDVFARDRRALRLRMMDGSTAAA